MSSINMISNKIQSRRLAWQTRGSTVDKLTSSNTGTTFFGQQYGHEPNVLDIETASTMTPPLSSNLLSYPSSTHALTSQFELFVVCFDRQNGTPHCLLFPVDQKKRLAQLIKANLCSTKPREAVPHDETPSANHGARQNHYNTNGNTLFSQTEKRSGADKYRNWYLSKN